MAKKRKSPRSRLRRVLRSKFYRAYFVVVLLCIVGIAAGARYLGGLLEDYEIAQPAHVAEDAVRMFESADYETIYGYDTSARELAAGDRDFYLQSMHEIADGKSVSWAEAYSPDPDERRYSVSLDGERFAEMTLVPSGQTTGHGNTLWRLGSVTTYVTLGEREPEPTATPDPEPTGILCHITAPSESTVLADGVRLTEAEVVNDQLPTASAGMLPEGVPSPTLTEYAFYSETGAPELQVTDKYGNPQQVSESGEYSWSCPLPETPGLRELFEEPAVKVGEKIARLAARTIYKENVLSDCAANSPAYASVDAFDINSGYKSTPSSFENIVTSSFYQYSDDCFSCHVEFDYLAKYSSTNIRTYPTTLTLYFINQKGKGKLYSFTLY